MENLNVKQLQAELRERQLPITGTKRVLISRIKQHDKSKRSTENFVRNEITDAQNSTPLEVPEIELVNVQESTASSECPSMDDSDLRAREWDIIKRERELIEKERAMMKQEKVISEKLKLLENRTMVRTTDRTKVNCSIREIADALPSFTPGEITSISAEGWIKRVESLMKIYDWDERALLLAAASKMHGPARYWWDTTQEVSSTWNELAKGLKANFPQHHSEVEIHQQLTKRIRRPHESIETYCHEMNMLGKRINLSDKSVIQYILTGLNDHHMMSSLAASDLKEITEVVEKVKWYEGIRANFRQHVPISIRTNNRPNPQQQNWQPRNIVPTPRNVAPMQKKNNVNCYNCNQPGHYSRQCPQGRKRPFQNYPDNNNRNQTREDKPEKRFRVNSIKRNDGMDCYRKQVTVEGVEFEALLDSGSERTIITRTVANTLKSGFSE